MWHLGCGVRVRVFTRFHKGLVHAFVVPELRTGQECVVLVL